MAKKPWVESDDASDAADAAQDARNAAAKVTGRGAANERVMNTPMKKVAAKSRQQMLYGKDED